MTGKILQLNFKFNVLGKEYEDAVTPLADKFANVKGLRWKIWLINESESEAGGIYYFKDESTLNEYLESELATAVKNHPALSDFSVKRFDIMDEVTTITRGPVHEIAHM